MITSISLVLLGFLLGGGSVIAFVLSAPEGEPSRPSPVVRYFYKK